MRASEPSLQPPRWAQALLRFAVPCDPMRDAILGDLHEEFTHDVAQAGVQRARVRYVRRSAGIVAHALSDAVICRSWVSTVPAVPPQHATGSSHAGNGEGRASASGRVRGTGSDAGFAVVALFVVVVAIVVNTMLFSATQARGPRVSSAAGIGGVVLLVACVTIAAVVICAGPRWRRNRKRGA